MGIGPKFSEKNRWAAAIVAIMAVLAVVIGPLCAPICSATFCARGAEDEGCHGSRAQHSDGAKGSLTAIKTCRAGTSVATLSNPEEKRPILQATRNASAALVAIGDSNVPDGLNIASRARWRDRSSPGAYSEVSLQTIVLRI